MRRTVLTSRALIGRAVAATQRSHRMVCCEALESRQLLCGLHVEPGSPDSRFVPPSGASTFGPDNSTIVWTNRGLADDNFASVFGASAEAARQVIDATILSWARVIQNFNFPDLTNTLNLTIRMSSTGTGFGASAAYPIDVNGGKPKDSVIVIGRGNDTNSDGVGDGAGWFIDPTPTENSEFLGNIVNAFAGDAQAGSPALGLFDLLTVATLEMTHAVGITNDNRLQFISGGLNTTTGVADTAEGGGVGTFWAFQGPSIRHLMTSNNGGPDGQDFLTPVHGAGPGVPVNFGGFVYEGAQDSMNAVYENSRRYIVPDTAALIVKDAYGYTITNPQTYGTFYAALNSGTGQLVVRGAPGATAITVSHSGGVISVSVNPTVDVPGTGALAGAGDLPAFVSQFNVADVSSISIVTGDGNDTITIDGIDSGSPITVNGGGGNDSIRFGANSLNMDNLQANVNVDGATGTDALSFVDTTNTTNSTYTITGASFARALSGMVSFSNVESATLDAGSGSSDISINSNAIPWTVNAGDGNDNGIIGGGDLDSNTLATIDFHGQGGNDQVIYNDAGDLGSDTFSLQTNYFTKTGIGTQFFSTVESVQVLANNDSNLVRIDGVLPGVQVLVNAGGGDDEVQITYFNGSLSDAQGPVQINGGSGANDRVLLFDDLNFSGQNYAITSTTVGRTGFGGLTYSALDSVVINGTPLADTYDISSTAAGTSVTLFPYIGADNINVNETNPTGPVLINASDGDDLVTVNGDGVGTAVAQFLQTDTIGSLTIGAGGSASIAAGGSRVLTTRALSISAGGVLDLTDNSMIVDYNTSSPIGTIGSLLTTGYALGTWSGLGITSSLAAIASTTPDKTAVGFAEATDLFTTFPAPFAGQQVDDTSVLLRYTLAGDANLDKAVNGADFNILASSFGLGGRRWSSGDFTFDTLTNGADFNVLAGNFGKTLSGGSEAMRGQPGAGAGSGRSGLFGDGRRIGDDERDLPV